MKPRPLASVIMVCLVPHLLAQTPEELKRRLDNLQQEMHRRQSAFDQRLQRVEGERESLRQQLEELAGKYADLEERYDEERLVASFEEVVNRTVKFYERPLAGQKPRSVFSALQGGLIFSGLFRMRFELLSHTVDFRANGLDDEGAQLDGRFVLGFGAVVVDDQAGNRITAVTQIQGAGKVASNTFVPVLSGSGPVLVPDEFGSRSFTNVTLYQAYLDFEGVIADGLRVRAGVQELVFGSQFVFGNDSFFAGLAHGAVLAEWENPARSFRLSALYAREGRADADTISNFSNDFDDDEMAAAYLEWEAAPDLTLEGYGVYFNARSPLGGEQLVTGGAGSGFTGALREFLVGSFWTLGARLFWSPIELLGGHLSLNAEVAYQTGANRLRTAFGTVPQTLHGWAAEVIANYRFDKEMDGLAPILTLSWYYVGGGEDRLSATPPRHIGFQPLFTNRHFVTWNRDNLDAPYFPGGGRLGNMDLIPSANIHVLKAGLSVSPAKDVEVGLTYLLAVTADNQGWGTGLFGHEIDLFAVYRHPGTTASVELSASLALFLPEETARDQSSLLFLDASTGPAGGHAAIGAFVQALVSF